MCQMPGKGNTKSHRSRAQRLPACAKGEKMTLHMRFTCALPGSCNLPCAQRKCKSA